jgi:hypothetical protein
VREMPSEERPRERLERYGERSLQTAELLAILLRVGVHGENVIELSTRLLRHYGGLHGLLTAEMPELCAEHGLGQAKATTLKAALELGRRFTVEAPQERPQITQPQDVVNLGSSHTQRHVLVLHFRSQAAAGSGLRQPSDSVDTSPRWMTSSRAGGLFAGTPHARRPYRSARVAGCLNSERLLSGSAAAAPH